MEISKRMGAISGSITLAISAKAKEMKRQGADVIGFGAGEPDFDTPEHIKMAAKKAIDEGFTKYTPASGMKTLKTAICKKFKDDNNLLFKEENILVSCGAKHSLFNAIVTLCGDNDEVLLPAPYWVSYPEMIKAAGAVPVIIPTTQENNFKVSVAQLEEALTPRTKLIILNSPSNPTGAVYTKSEIEELALFVVNHNLYCISDEIYEKILFGKDFQYHSIAAVNHAVQQKTIVVNGVSKAYAMTGWRIGYSAASKEITLAMSNLQSHSTSNPATISQYAALAALEGPQDCVRQMVAQFDQRRRFIVEHINRIEGLSCFDPQGAFYVFPSIARLIGKKYEGITIDGSMKFCELLLETEKVAAVPGIAFGSDDCIRLSYAAALEVIETGVKRIESFAQKLH